jgi:excisionase family DNA binding protein
MEYLTPKAAASSLVVRVPTVCALIRSGQLPAVDVSVNPDSKRPSWRISREALDEFIANRAKQVPAPKPTRRSRKSSTPARFYA